ncbi:hypothetical protein SAY86_024891 [Trapa natans]|uniref:Uncharacterized protein n=1 Tax=Trapa natans TaxID=22666 RepID=A0AAN7M6P3_TRANT|nr:hypothetical protein SAY86_024891 [Trapa natans]
MMPTSFFPLHQLVVLLCYVQIVFITIVMRMEFPLTILPTKVLVVILGLETCDSLGVFGHTQGMKLLIEARVIELLFLRMLEAMKDYSYLVQDHLGSWFSEKGIESILRFKFILSLFYLHQVEKVVLNTVISLAVVILSLFYLHQVEKCVLNAGI